MNFYFRAEWKNGKWRAWLRTRWGTWELTRWVFLLKRFLPKSFPVPPSPVDPGSGIPAARRYDLL